MATASQVAGAVTEGVATNVAETSANNAINSMTGANEMENINAPDAATNSLANTATGNVAANLLSRNSSFSKNTINKITTAVVGAAEGARKVYSEVKKDDKSK